MQLHGRKKRRVLMNAFITSQFSCCPLVWMFHSRTLNNRINKIHEQALRLAYKNETFSSFDDLLERDKSVSIYQKNLQILATEIYKTKNYERYFPLYTKTIQFEK